MEKCFKCGSDLPAGALFCNNCGAKIEANTYLDETSKPVSQDLQKKEKDSLSERIYNKNQNIAKDLNGNAKEYHSPATIGKKILIIILTTFFSGFLFAGLITTILAITSMTVKLPYTESVEATVVDIQEIVTEKYFDNSDDVFYQYEYVYTFDYTYEDADYRYRETLYNKTKEVGDLMTLYVNPDVPSDASVSSPDMLRKVHIGVLIFGIVMIGIGVALIFIVRFLSKNKVKHESVEDQMKKGLM